MRKPKWAGPLCAYHAERLHLYPLGGLEYSCVQHPDSAQQYPNAGFTPTAEEWARFAAGAANLLQTPLSKAKAYAAQVRARNPQMQVKRLSAPAGKTS